MSAQNSSQENIEKTMFNCTQHETILFDNILNLYEKNEHCDTIMNIGRGKNCVIIQAHRIVLCSFSQFFMKAFNGDGQDTVRGNVLELKDIESSILKPIIDFMYSGSIELTLDSVERYLRAACFLDIKTLAEVCCEFISKNHKSRYGYRLSKESESLSIDQPSCSQVVEDQNSLKTTPINKLQIVEISKTDEIRIQSYNREVKSWSVEKLILLSKKKNKCSTIVIDQKLIVVGGIDSNEKCISNSVECLDLDTFKWSDLSPMKYSRCFPKLAHLQGNLCVFGGSDKDHFEASIELYNFATTQWNTVKSPFQITQKSEIAAHNGILYILDFYSGHLNTYDVLSNKWTSNTIEKDFISDFGLVAVEGFLYLIGGSLEKTFKRYNLSNDTWNVLAALTHDCCDNIKTTIFENNIVIYAKAIDNNVIVELYNFETNSWSALNSFSIDGAFKVSAIYTVNA
ncbi:kelch-like protein 3 [Episyrphus balteatus]|uniref:kelch-like protein 3 n=1 Tax=Episyrphus balteatus TaxID=286459 RepID=UPI0024859170|nr:kelch-like protein 3 [Episyrphus balteatus]